MSAFVIRVASIVLLVHWFTSPSRSRWTALLVVPALFEPIIGASTLKFSCTRFLYLSKQSFSTCCRSICRPVDPVQWALTCPVRGPVCLLNRIGIEAARDEGANQSSMALAKQSMFSCTEPDDVGHFGKTSASTNHFADCKPVYSFFRWLTAGVVPSESARSARSTHQFLGTWESIWGGYVEWGKG